MILAGMSMVPTLEFLSWRKAVKAGQAPSPTPGKIRRVRMILHIELAGIVLILLCAAIIVRSGWN